MIKTTIISVLIFESPKKVRKWANMYRLLAKARNKHKKLATLLLEAYIREKQIKNFKGELKNDKSRKKI